MREAGAGVTPRFYEPELDALRFCAFVAVFLFHAAPSEFGGRLAPLLQAARNALSFGVPVFFLLSAYLITKLLLLEREKTGGVAIRAFYVRRVLRIWPLYLLFLAAMWGLGRVGVFAPVEGSRLLASVLFAGNVYVAWFGFAASPMLPLWTISIEEQFYLVWPALARAGARALQVGAWTVLGMACAAVVALRVWATEPMRAIWTSSLVEFQFFALGSLLALRFVHRLPRFGRGARGGLLAGGLALMLVAAGPFRVNTAGVPLGAAAMLVGFELMATGVVLIFLAFLGAAQGGLRVPSVVTYLGKISYGLYVLHVMALELCGQLATRLGVHGGFRTVTGFLLTVGLAAASYRWLETPFLVLKDRFAPIRTRAV